MKKILSVMLIFVLSITFVGIRGNVSAADGDATIYFHIHQFDGDYTGTGIGIWDGRDDVGWNPFAEDAASHQGAVWWRRGLLGRVGAAGCCSSGADSNDSAHHSYRSAAGSRSSNPSGAATSKKEICGVLK